MIKLLTGVVGIALILLVAVALSSNRRAIRLRVVGAAFGMQAGIALVLLYVPWGARGARLAVGARWRAAHRPSKEHCLRLQPLISVRPVAKRKFIAFPYGDRQKQDVHAIGSAQRQR